MALLIPSNPSKSRQKSHRDNFISARDYPDTSETDLSDGEIAYNLIAAEGRPPTELLINDETQKMCPIPVIQTDPFEQMEADEYGAELGADARVWKVYVKETNLWDAELVDGWNKSLDVILVFAALFSAISTAFLIESSGMLQQDPNDISAAALVSISATLRAMANGSSIRFTASEPAITPEFIPSPHAVVVNTLWYLSLSLSVATSLLAMLAKDWCHSFTAKRTGNYRDQALRRQHKWVMIESWKMQELITALPFFIHISLMLFAIGLSIYVWDMNQIAAIPVICVSGAAFAFYLCSSAMASFVPQFPYTTTISRVTRSKFMRPLIDPAKKILGYSFGYMLSLPIIPLAIVAQLLFYLITGAAYLQACILDLLHFGQPTDFAGGDSYYSRCKVAVQQFNADLEGKLESVIKDVSKKFAQYGIYFEWYYGDYKYLTSLALKWLLEHCETPSSVAITLQAIAGASSKIPKEPLESCGAAQRIFRQLVSSSVGNGPEKDIILYARALTFLQSSSKTRREAYFSKDSEDTDVLFRKLKENHELQVVVLIDKINFSTEDFRMINMTNTAISLSSAKLRSASCDLSNDFNSIIGLLLGHTQSTGQQLGPATLHSLSYAAIILASCSTVTLFSPAIRQKCMQSCMELLHDKWGGFPNRPMIYPHAAFLVCILLHPIFPFEQRSVEEEIKGNPRLINAANLLLDNLLRQKPYRQSVFFRVAFYEILFNSDRYLTADDKPRLGLDDHQAFSTGCGLGAPQTVDQDQPIMYKSEIVANSPFLRAIPQVYDLVHSAQSGAAIAEVLPTPVYHRLVLKTCLAWWNSEGDSCKRLLSRFAFPRISDYFAQSVLEILDTIWKSYTPTIATPSSSCLTHYLRLSIDRAKLDKTALEKGHFAATQLWLWLYLIGDSSTPQQEQLRFVLTQNTKLEIQEIGLKQVKLSLGKEVIESYKKGHHLGEYSTRVVECILEDSKSEGHEELLASVQATLKGVSQGLRGLSSFSSVETSMTNHKSSSTEAGPSSIATFRQVLATELPSHQSISIIPGALKPEN